MPLARIDLLEGKSAQYRRTIADVVYEQMIECLGVPEDRFQTITEHKPENFLFDADYLSYYRSENCIFIQLIFLDVASADQRRPRSTGPSSTTCKPNCTSDPRTCSSTS